MAISVIIPSYNSRDTILPCLRSICDEDVVGCLEIIVADSSIDNTPELIRSSFPEVCLLQFDRKTDPGSARNKGAEIASGDILAFVDSDCIVLNGWLSNVEAASRRGFAAVGGSVGNANPCSIIGWAGYLMEFSEWFPGGCPRTIGHIPSCNIAYQKAVFAQVGGFPSVPFPPSGAAQEDLILNASIVRSGGKIWYDPTIQVKHFNRIKFKDYMTHQFARGRSANYIRNSQPGFQDLFSRHPWLAPFIVPMRLGAILLRVLEKKPVYLIAYMVCLPLLFGGAVSWASGFVQQSMSKHNKNT